MPAYWPGLLMPDVPRLLVLRVALRLPGLLDRELGRRVGLEPLVRDRHTAADGSPVAAIVEPLQRAIDRREPVAHAVGDRVVHAPGGRRRGRVDGIDSAFLVLGLPVLLPRLLRAGQQALHLGPLGLQQ